MTGIEGSPVRIQSGSNRRFDASAGKGMMPEDVVRAKLRTMAEGARIAGNRLGIG